MMRRDRIPALRAAGAYIARFNPAFRDKSEAGAEEEILKSADILAASVEAIAVSTYGFYVKFYDDDDRNGDIDVWVDPSLWEKAENR
jgi:hypothetical protein